MSKDLPINANFYTFEELKDFTNNFTDLSILNAAAFIETKTRQEYCIVKRKMLYELKNALSDNNLVTFDIQKFLNELREKYKDDTSAKDLLKNIETFINIEWYKVVERNTLIAHKWENELKPFDSSEGTK